MITVTFAKASLQAFFHHLNTMSGSVLIALHEQAGELTATIKIRATL